MTVENATYIAQLRSDWPLGTDELPEGDNHIRMFKGCMQTQFPGLGVTAPVNASETEMNHLVGVTSSIQTQLNTVNPVEVGMRFLCYAAAPPSNGRWVLFDGGEDIVPLLRNQYGVASGGSWPISGLTAGRTEPTTLTAQQSGVKPHQHLYGEVKGTHDPTGGGGYLTSGAGSDLATPLHPGEPANEGHDHGPPDINSDGTWRPAFRETVILELLN